jgi:RimJ/RimL family protein N-acetyltransferase
MIVGERVTLRPFQADDLPALRRWHDDGEAKRGYGPAQPLVPAHAFAAELAPGGRFTTFGTDGTLCICDEADRPIGLIDYQGLESPARHCELGIFIGEQDAQNRGYGSEAIVLMLDWLFNQRAAHRVWLTTSVNNVRAQRVYEKVGFVREGTWREHWYSDGAWHDEHLYGILAGDFNARYRPDGFTTRRLRRPM